MADLSPEVNRLLGTALLDPDWCRQLLGPARLLAIQGFALTPAERRAILTSPATCLHELAADILVAMSSIPGEGNELITTAISATIDSPERRTLRQDHDRLWSMVRERSPESLLATVH